MNKFNLAKVISKASTVSPMQEIIKLAAIVAATCLAYKIEDIVKATMSEKNDGEVYYKEEN